VARLLERAKAFAAEERYDEAIAEWLSALYRLPDDEAAGVWKRLGLAFRQTDRLPEAWHFLSRYLASPEGRDDATVRGWFREVEESLKRTHVRIRISCRPEDASVRFPTPVSDPCPIYGSCPLDWWYRPGTHEVGVGAAGFLPSDFRLEVLEQDDPGARELVLAPVPPKPLRRSAEWALIGSGLALGAVGGVVNAVGWKVNRDLRGSSDTQAEYDESRRNRVRPLEIAAYSLYGVAGAAALSGVITWLARRPRGDARSGSDVMVTPMTAPGGVGALMTIGF
ncbi:MAG: hypothetical protein FJ098_15025, partial [Deltaproteobacteria bacterium]|nr:hypothetical protein [Deltaproteobacteria bacterium]